jgi:pSer/pThr/pTyr-binding forkhead associated (FHA) protein
MPARLVALDGTADIPLAGLLTVVGRHRGCDVHLDSSRVSRRHCCLALGGDQVLVRDLGSTNGVRINGLRVDVGLLHPGDVLEIAHLRFRLVLQRPASAGVPSAALGPDRRAASPAPESVPGMITRDDRSTDGECPHRGAAPGR